MKYTFRIPTTDPYAYVEVEMDDKDMEGRDVSDVYHSLIGQFKPSTGLDNKLFNKFIDNQLNGVGNDIEEYNQMSPEQQLVVQTVKRSIKRIEAKHASHNNQDSEIH